MTATTAIAAPAPIVEPQPLLSAEPVVVVVSASVVVVCAVAEVVVVTEALSSHFAKSSSSPYSVIVNTSRLSVKKSEGELSVSLGYTILKSDSIIEEAEVEIYAVYG